MELQQAYQLVVEAIREQGTVQFPVRGHSMWPLLDEGDMVTIVPLGRSAEVGDVLLFSYEQMLILHRVVKVKESDGVRSLVMRGDNNEDVETITEKDVMGRMSAVVRRNGGWIESQSVCWRWRSRWILAMHPLQSWARRYFNVEKRRKMLPWYFLLIAVLMWAPLNGLGVPLDNFVFGIRLDHLLHASVYIPCTWFLATGKHQQYGWIWLLGVLVGVVTEFGQYLLPYRGFDINDMVANAMGVSLGWLLWGLHRKGVA